MVKLRRSVLTYRLQITNDWLRIPPYGEMVSDQEIQDVLKTGIR